MTSQAMVKLADELKSCPFCGGDAEMREAETCHDTWLVRCTDCGCKTMTSYTKEESAQTWNFRLAAAPAASLDATNHRNALTREIHRIVGSDLSRAQCSNLADAILALTAPPLPADGVRGRTIDVRNISDENMRDLLTAKDVGAGRGKLKRILAALASPHEQGEG